MFFINDVKNDGNLTGNICSNCNSGKIFQSCLFIHVRLFGINEPSYEQFEHVLVCLNVAMATAVYVV